jgi:Tol biopolymer transport system component
MISRNYSVLRDYLEGKMTRTAINRSSGLTLLLSTLVLTLSSLTLGQGRIAFTSCGDNNCEIFAINPDGTGLVQLTFNPADDTTPSYAANGSKIVFASNRSGQYHIWSMDPDGTHQTLLTTTSNRDFWPAISSDGSRIAFGSTRDQGTGEIYVMYSDGSGVVRLTNDLYFDDTPSFSPDGSKIVFCSNRGGPFNIWGMNADGTNPVRLTTSFKDLYPSFSPSGLRITFMSVRDHVSGEIYTMNPDG